MMGERDKALELALTQIEKQFGKGSIMKLGQAGSQKGVDVISTGSISLDSCLGSVGFLKDGLPKFTALKLQEKPA